MRRAGLGLITLIALCFAGQAPAGAASKPGSVGLVSYTAATRTSLTVAWHKASRAKTYQIFVSTSYSGVAKAKPYRTTKNLQYKVTGLKSGVNYYIQVRAMNGSTAGSRSARVGHRTIQVPQADATGPKYKVMTYNICARVCTENNVKHNNDYYTYGKWSVRMPGAVERITSHKPDVVMLQEASCGPPGPGDILFPYPQYAPEMAPPEGYAEVGCRSAKRLFYNDARFDLAVGEECMDDDPPPPAVTDCTHGSIYLGNHGGGKRYAVWAELVDTAASNRHVIFVSVHLVNGESEYTNRKTETYTLLDEIEKVNPEGFPVIYGGDFNSFKNRSPDTVATAFNLRGYHDSFELAMALKYQHYNSYNDFQTTPKLSIKWGDHLDHVWVDSARTRVTSWSNGARLVGGKYPHPIPSDHNPIVVSVQVN